MVRIRIIDERLLALQRQGRIGFYAEARGQEAAVIGAAAALAADDCRRAGAPRGGRGALPRAAAAQLRRAALRQRQRHRARPADAGHPGTPRALNYVPLSSCVATQLPHGVGIAWAAQDPQGRQTVVLGYLGEGGTSAEDFHVAAELRGRLPHAGGLPLPEQPVGDLDAGGARRRASETFAIKALAYGMPGVRVDGNDVFAVYAATKRRSTRARAAAARR